MTPSLEFDAESTLSARTILLGQLYQSLRPGQKRLCEWEGGRMAISAVPGAGKSHSLAVAAVTAIAKQQLHARKQLVIVTYTRSAASSIKSKVKAGLKALQLPPNSFTVQTLHGLALNIATRYPRQSGLNLEESNLIVPNTSHRIIRTTVEQWINANTVTYGNLIQGTGFDGEESERLRRQSILRTEILPELAHTVIRSAKSSGLTPAQLWQWSEYSKDSYNILAISAGLYEQYELLMRTKNFIDYDDMILAALRALEDDTIRKQLQSQYFAVFEDEAQDSSPLQEKLITLLADREGLIEPNLIRVGDPNQAINSTFTPADPVYFNWFCQTCEENGNLATMAQAGRSNPKIIEAANFILRWAHQQWRRGNPTRPDSESPFRVQDIQPVAADDIQPNPPPSGEGVEIYQPQDIYETVNSIEKRVIELLAANPDHNAAILVRENRQGRFLAQKLGHLGKSHGIRVFEANEIDRFSRIPEEMYKLLVFFDRPHSPDNLKAALEILQQRELIQTMDLNPLSTYPEQFLYPTALQILQTPQKPAIETARRYCSSLLKAKIELPHYQLMPFLAMTLKYTGSELATAQKLASRIYGETAGNSSLKSTIEALNNIIVSERFEGVEEENDDQYTRKGQLTIITMHKAKGLDWDYVFIPFLHEDIMPGNLRAPKGAKFLGDYTLAEVARLQIRNGLHSEHFRTGEGPIIPGPSPAWEAAKQLKIAEEYRLFYVAMTRAKRLLWMSAEKEGFYRWSVFREDNAGQLQEKKASPVIEALRYLH
ncbi:MAG: RecBCD enzyme subunit RecB [Chroococcopsis gigantea SAG 12.99]|jgi:DNA helicase-2/ATP-dependent DNA helicase PcrA|nr:RecBCD enzyme subunit RecB [Chroococcopsis gigantea SAG 12.99]